MRILLPVLTLTLLATPCAWADEAAPDVVDETRAAERVGRLLVSPDTERRAEGETRLLERIARGGDLAGFVRAMGRATATWANSEARLLEVWIEQAVDGTAAERDQAVRLIHALGEPATRRLVLELRHARVSTPTDQVKVAQPPPAVQGDVAHVTAQESVPHTPAVYEIAILGARDMNTFQIRRFLTKNADASRVAALGEKYVVFATVDGHARLERALSEARQTVQQLAADAPAYPAAPAPAPALTAEPAAQPAQGPAKRETPPDGPRYSLTPLVVRVPADTALSGYIGKWPGSTAAAVSALMSNERGSGTSVLIGSLDDARAWRKAAPRLPDAKTVTRPAFLVTAGPRQQLFVGEPVAYRKNLRREKGGGWGIEPGVLRTGLDLTLTLLPEGDGLRVTIRARLSAVSRPMATSEQVPESGAEPVELDVPEWNRQSRVAQTTLPTSGGGILLVIPDPEGENERLAVVVLTIEPVPVVDQQRQNAAPQPPKTDSDG